MPLKSIPEPVLLTVLTAPITAPSQVVERFIWFYSNDICDFAGCAAWAGANLENPACEAAYRVFLPIVDAIAAGLISMSVLIDRVNVITISEIGIAN